MLSMSQLLKRMLVPSMVKIIAHGTAFARPARTGDNVPIIITIPKDIVRAMKIKKGENLRLYTDGDKIYIDRFQESS
jgi:Antidote-toxin recognition MazE, bacterial antitoxin